MQAWKEVLKEEVKPGLNPLDFNIKSMKKRLSKRGDIWKEVLGEGIDMHKALDRIS